MDRRVWEHNTIFVRMQRAASLLSLFLVLLLITHQGVAQTPAPDDITDQCRALMSPDTPNLTGPDAPAIRITNLAEEDTIFGSQLAVSVETENFELSPTGNHWHLWVDGTLQMMVYGPTAIIDIPPGTHQVCVLMGDAEHFDLGTPDGLMLTVMEAGAGTPTTTPPVARSVAETYSQPENQDGPLTLLVLLVLAASAAFMGWFIGSRLGKQRR